MEALHAIRKVLAMRTAVALLVPLCILDLSTTPIGGTFSEIFLARTTCCYVGYDDFIGRRTEQGVEVIAADRVWEGEFPPDHWVHGDPPIQGYHNDRWFERNGPWGPIVHGVRCTFIYHEAPDIPIGTDPEVFEAGAIELKNFGYWTGPLPSKGANHARENIHWFGTARHIFGPLLLIATLWSVKLNFVHGVLRYPARRQRDLIARRICPACKYDLSATAVEGKRLGCPECGIDWPVSESEGTSP